MSNVTFGFHFDNPEPSICAAVSVTVDCHSGAQSVFAIAPDRHLVGSSITPRDRARCRLVKSPVS